MTTRLPEPIRCPSCGYGFILRRNRGCPRCGVGLARSGEYLHEGRTWFIWDGHQWQRFT